MTHWMEQARCVGQNPELFFPPSGGAHAVVVAQAKAICTPCPVRDLCRQFAVDEHLEHGVFGGQNAYERSVGGGPVGDRACLHCAGPIPLSLHRNAQFCSSMCRARRQHEQKTASNQRSRRRRAVA